MPCLSLKKNLQATRQHAAKARSRARTMGSAAASSTPIPAFTSATVMRSQLGHRVGSSIVIQIEAIWTFYSTSRRPSNDRLRTPSKDEAMPVTAGPEHAACHSFTRIRRKRPGEAGGHACSQIADGSCPQTSGLGPTIPFSTPASGVCRACGAITVKTPTSSYNPGRRRPQYPIRGHDQVLCIPLQSERWCGGLRSWLIRSMGETLDNN